MSKAYDNYQSFWLTRHGYEFSFQMIENFLKENHNLKLDTLKNFKKEFEKLKILRELFSLVNTEENHHAYGIQLKAMEFQLIICQAIQRKQQIAELHSRLTEHTDAY